MKIDRSNYEIWLIDWLDGNLNDFQISQLRTFLNENPDLREESEELNNLFLNPAVKQFPHKEHLEKTTADLSESQFELLCVASLENDISRKQQDELFTGIEFFPDKKRTRELILKLKLTPEDIIYKHKKRLKKRTPTQRILFMSLIGLSAAAVITMMIIMYPFLPRSLQNGKNNISQNNKILADSSITKPAFAEIPENKLSDHSRIKNEKSFAVIQRKNTPQVTKATTLLALNDSLLREKMNPVPKVQKVPVVISVNLNNEISHNTLIAYNSSLIKPSNPNMRSKLSRFLAKTFREKILKEGLSNDRPLKGYEIAEAGITGLNKLLGWQMTLEKNTNKNGETQSVYFSSKLLKFKASVDSSEPIL